MGLETDIFVAGEKISQSFICPICHGVVEPAVSTPCEHLFCEECLLRWFERKDRGSESCPSCNQVSKKPQGWVAPPRHVASAKPPCLDMCELPPRARLNPNYPSNADSPQNKPHKTICLVSFVFTCCNQLIDAESVSRPPRIIQNLVRFDYVSAGSHRAYSLLLPACRSDPLRTAATAAISSVSSSAIVRIGRTAACGQVRRSDTLRMSR